MRLAIPATLLSLPLAFASPAAADDDEVPGLSIYGFARLDVLADDSRLSAVETPAYVMLEPAGGQLDGELTMTPRLSRLGLTIDPFDLDNAGKVTTEGKLEIDFAGGDGAATIRLRQAYASIQLRKYSDARPNTELLAGQADDVVSPLYPTVQDDTQLRFAGNLGERRPQLRLSLRPKHAHLAAAFTTTNGAPSLQWLAEYDLPRHLHMRTGISGHIARSPHPDGASDTSFAVAGHAYVNAGKVAMLGEMYAGRGLADIGGGIGQTMSEMTNKPVTSMGGWAELAVMPTRKHLLAVGRSIEVIPEQELAPGDRARNSTFYSSLRYRPKPILQLGLEHVYWKTHYHQMGTGVANRFNMHFSIFF